MEERRPEGAMSDIGDDEDVERVCRGCVGEDSCAG